MDGTVRFVGGSEPSDDMASPLTADAPVVTAPRPGAIVLARHGEPALSRKVRLTASEYREFWANYEVGGIRPDRPPPASLSTFADKAGTLVASTRRRSIESAETLAPGRAFARDPLFIEAPLPPPNWPNWVRLSPSVWGFIARFWWWFFDHNEGQESRRAAEVRADQAAGLLIDLASTGEDVVVLAHGFFNVMIGRALKARGWRLAAGKGYKYWSLRRYERI